MNMMRIGLLAAALVLIGGSAYAITFNVTGTIQAAPVIATAGSCAPMATMQYPIAPGTQVCPIAITPSNWTGSVVVDDAVHFQTVLLNGQWWLKTGATSPPLGQFSVNVTVAP